VVPLRAHHVAPRLAGKFSGAPAHRALGISDLL